MIAAFKRILCRFWQYGANISGVISFDASDTDMATSRKQLGAWSF
jgi:hypothetical protein